MQTRVGRTARLLLVLFTTWFVFISLLATPARAEGMRERQWYLDAMQADQMWQVSKGEGITVAVIDGKVDATVPELRGQVLAGKDFIESGGSDAPSGHATGMAIHIAGRGQGNGPWGLAPAAKILPLATGGRDRFKYIAQAIRYAAQQEAQIINISLSGSVLDEERVLLQEAVDYANSAGTLIFAGTGNHGDEANIPTSPADLPGVVGVGAIDKSLKVADFSVHGPQVGLTAPGVEMPTLCFDSPGYCISKGTSDATAIASASAALIWSKHPDWTNNQVLRVLMETAVKPNDGVVPSEYLGYGIVRPRKVLLDNEGNPGAPDVNPLFPNYDPSEPSASPSEDATNNPPEKGDYSGVPPAEQASDDSSGDMSAWLIVSGVATVALVGAGTIYLVVRQRAPY